MEFGDGGVFQESQNGSYHCDQNSASFHMHCACDENKEGKDVELTSHGCHLDIFNTLVDYPMIQSNIQV